MSGPVLETDPTGGGWEATRDGRLWISAGPPRPGWWRVLHEQHERTGLWPLLLGSLSDRDPDRPWRDGDDFFPELIRTRPGDHDSGAVLRQWWANVTPVEEEDEMDDVIAPFTRDWPGLAPPGVPRADPAGQAALVADDILANDWLTTPRLGLVRSARGADTLTDVAWTGPVNHENDTALFSAVLRDWEERFGARVIGLGFATLYLSVASPPAGPDAALRVAAEHYAFCPDNVDQGCGSMTEYAEDLPDAPGWSFWWD